MATDNRRPAFDASRLDWDKGDGLLPVIVQDAATLRVLMLGYMNREALQATLASGRVTFFSRSKQRLWTKGHPRDFKRSHLPITIRVGEAVEAPRDQYAGAITRRLRERVQELLDAAQRAYPGRPKGPEDSWWLPAHLGGTAPTAEALRTTAQVH